MLNNLNHILFSSNINIIAPINIIKELANKFPNTRIISRDFGNLLKVDDMPAYTFKKSKTAGVAPIKIIVSPILF